MQIDTVRVVGGVTAKGKESKENHSIKHDILLKSIYPANYANGMVGMVVGLIVGKDSTENEKIV